MIDPRALQQHFKKVQQQQSPPKRTVPRVIETTPLTSIQAIPVVIEQVHEIIEIPETIENVSEIVTAVPEPVQTFIAEISSTGPDLIPETNKKTEQKVIDDYDPYGYYSGPLF